MDKSENQKKPTAVKTRNFVHIGFCMLMFLVIIVINALNSDSVISLVFKIAAYTYGPLLGLYVFGLFAKGRKVTEKLVPIICILAPAITFVISVYSKELFGNYEFAEELIIVNSGLTFLGLLAISHKSLEQTKF